MRLIQALCALAAMLATSVAADIPRTESGKPDLSGYYDGGSLTPLERPRDLGDKEFLTPEEAAALSTGTEFLNDGRSNDPNRLPPKKGGDGINDFGAGNVGGYNAFWVDPGSGVVAVDGKFRTSIVYDPPNGRRPPMTPKAMMKMADNFSSFSHDNDGTASWLDQDGPGPFDAPEELALAERCLLGFSAGPPMLPGLYNNFKRIVQSEDNVMILVEMVHDARIVRMNAEHAPPNVRRWLGDSVGHWDGDTLVVESTHFIDGTGDRWAQTWRMPTHTMHLVERFTRLDADTLQYEFTLTDPAKFTAPWSVRIPLTTNQASRGVTEGPLYEYACHEGNYSIANVLRGARVEELAAGGEQH